MKAWIENGKIFATKDMDLNIPYPTFEFSDDIDIKHLKITGENIILKTEEEINFDTFQELKQQKLEEFFIKIKQIEYLVIGKYPESERLNWPYKVAEAKRIIIENDFSSCDIIKNELIVKLGREPNNQELLERANVILYKYGYFIDISSKISAIRDLIEKASTIEELNQIDIENVL